MEDRQGYTNRHNSKGTGMLELVLFAPIALSLLFLFFDCAARFYQNSVANDLLRSTLNDASQSSLSERDISGNLFYPSKQLENFVNNLAEELSSELSSAFQTMPGRSPLQHRIRVEIHQNNSPTERSPLAKAELGDQSLVLETPIMPTALPANKLRLLAFISAPTRGILPQNPLNQSYFQIDTAWVIGLE